MKVYIAGPITLGDQAVNVKNAITAADTLLERGHTPFVPHLTWFWHFHSPKHWQAWIDYDLHWLAVCDCLLRPPGESKGADKEVAEADRLAIPVLFEIDDVGAIQAIQAIPDEAPRMLHRPSPFQEVLAEIAELHDAKQHDYGRDADPFANIRASEEFNIPAWLGAVVRGNDKMSRLKTFAQKGVLKNESVEDSLKDLAVYALIALVLFREEIV